MYDYGYDYSYDYGSTASAVGALAGVGVIIWIIGIAISVFSIISMWKLFTKAGKKGWASLIPIYNNIVMIEIAELPMWYIALFFVPFANIYAMFKIYIEIAHKFGKSTGFGVGMVFLSIIFIPMLAFGKAEYKGSAPVNNNVGMQPSMQNNNTQYNPVNEQVNMPNSNLQSNIMDVNSGIQMQPMFDGNMQGSSSAFQPVGNVNNNVGDLNVNSVQPNTVQGLGSVSMTNGVNYVEPVNNIPVQPTGNLNNGVQFNNNQVLNQVNMNSGVVSTMPINDPVQPNNTQVNDLNTVQPNFVQNTSTVNLMQKSCPNCGSQMDFNAILCSNCGQNL